MIQRNIKIRAYCYAKRSAVSPYLIVTMHFILHRESLPQGFTWPKILTHLIEGDVRVGGVAIDWTSTRWAASGLRGRKANTSDPNTITTTTAYIRIHMSLCMWQKDVFISLVLIDVSKTSAASFYFYVHGIPSVSHISDLYTVSSPYSLQPLNS